MCSEFCEQLCQLKCNKTSSLEDSPPLQYSHEINRFYAIKVHYRVHKSPPFFYTEPSEYS